MGSLQYIGSLFWTSEPVTMIPDGFLNPSVDYQLLLFTEVRMGNRKNNNWYWYADNIVVNIPRDYVELDCREEGKVNLPEIHVTSDARGDWMELREAK